MFIRVLFLSAFFVFWVGIAHPQPLTCATGAVNPAVRAEGITETLGDILLNCSGGSLGTTITLNLVVFLNVSVTNRISATNATDVSLTIDTGSGPAPAGVPSRLGQREGAGRGRAAPPASGRRHPRDAGQGVERARCVR